MKNLLVVIFMIFSAAGFAQDKIKVKCKKGIIYVNKAEWGKYEDAAGKMFISTMTGEEFATVKSLEYGKGTYSPETGKEFMHKYCEVHFLKTDIEPFEVDAHPWDALGLMWKMKVAENNSFVKANALEYKTRYQDNVSEKVFLTK